MSDWRSGQFDRSRLSGLFRPFAPAHAAESLQAIDLDNLWQRGKRLLLLDVDHTIVAWRTEDFSGPVLDWIEKAKSMGFEICIISNARNLERLERIKTRLGVETVRGRFKPSRTMFRLALIKFKRNKEEAVMIGDQMMTDIFGANRAGIDAIWVRKMDSKEFGPTRLNRMAEGLLTSNIYKALVLPESRLPGEMQTPAVREITLVEQVFRFLIVGGASFVIDTTTKYILMRWIHVNGEELGIVVGRWLQSNVPSLFGGFSQPDKASAIVAGGIASFLAIFNSFVWNRAWTFEAKGRDRKSAQIARFYVVAIIGAILMQLLFTWFYNLTPNPGRMAILVSNVAAAAIASVWNFLGQRYFAFRTRPA